jgi:hypothetical protein
MMTATGTPYRRESVASVSPGATVIGIPPSELQAERAGGAAVTGSELPISAVAG